MDAQEEAEPATSENRSFHEWTIVYFSWAEFLCRNWMQIIWYGLGYCPITLCNNSCEFVVREIKLVGGAVYDTLHCLLWLTATFAFWIHLVVWGMRIEMCGKSWFMHFRMDIIIMPYMVDTEALEWAIGVWIIYTINYAEVISANVQLLSWNRHISPSPPLPRLSSLPLPSLPLTPSLPSPPSLFHPPLIHMRCLSLSLSLYPSLNIHVWINRLKG